MYEGPTWEVGGERGIEEQRELGSGGVEEWRSGAAQEKKQHPLTLRQLQMHPLWLGRLGSSPSVFAPHILWRAPFCCYISAATTCRRPTDALQMNTSLFVRQIYGLETTNGGLQRPN